MKDLGILSYLVGLKVSHNFKGCYLSQVNYVFDLLSRADITNGTHLELNYKLTLLDSTPLDDPTLY